MNEGTATQLTSFIDKLTSGCETSHVLQSFHRWIFSLETSELAKLAAELDFTPLFKCLFEAKPSDIDIVLEVFLKLLSFVPVRSKIPRLGTLLLHGLEHGSRKIKEVVLKQLETCIKDNEAIDQLSKNEDLMTAVAKLIGDNSLSVAKCSSDILISFGRRGQMIDLVLSPPISTILRNVLSSNDTNKFRVYEIVIKLASISSESLDLVTKSGFFQTFLSDINSKDELTLLSCLEVSKELIVTNHGFKFLSDLGIITTLAEMTITISDPLSRCLILPGLLKFFMNFGHTQPDYLFNHHVSIINSFFSLLEETDLVLMCVAIDGIGLLGCSLRGKVLLNEDGRMPFALKHFGTVLKTFNPEVKYNVLQALARLLRIKDHEKDVNPEFQDVLYDWFRFVAEDTGGLIFLMCQQPFAEVHHGALCVMSAVASYEWGQKVIVSIPGFMEFLLDRSTENTVPGKEAKFKIVESLVNSLTIDLIFDNQTVNELKEYYQKGPFYITAHTTVAVGEPL